MPQTEGSSHTCQSDHSTGRGNLRRRPAFAAAGNRGRCLRIVCNRGEHVDRRLLAGRSQSDTPIISIAASKNTSEHSVKAVSMHTLTATRRCPVRGQRLACQATILPALRVLNRNGRPHHRIPAVKAPPTPRPPHPKSDLPGTTAPHAGRATCGDYPTRGPSCLRAGRGQGCRARGW